MSPIKFLKVWRYFLHWKKKTLNFPIPYCFLQLSSTEVFKLHAQILKNKIHKDLLEFKYGLLFRVSSIHRYSN